MAVVINGTTGITSVNGSASAPSVTGTDTDTGIVYGTNTLSLATGGTTAVTVDSSQNVGIGTSSPDTKVHVYSSAGNSFIQSARATQSTGEVGFQVSGGTSGVTWYMYQPTSSNSLQWYGNGATRMVIDASGNVGIGTSSPTDSLSTGKALDVRGTDGSGLYVGSSDSSTRGFYVATSGAAYLGTYTNHPQIFRTNNTEKMRLDASGNLLVGVTSVPTNGASGAGMISCSTINAVAMRSRNGTSYGTNGFSFYWNGNAQVWVDGTNVGNMTLSSDYRIKKDIQTQTLPALERVMQLRPVTYEFQDYGDLYKADGVAREGFIAHELQAVIPSAVEGEKDAEDQIQSLKLDALCSVLTKAIQEQQVIIEQLRADVAQLKGQA